MNRSLIVVDDNGNATVTKDGKLRQFSGNLVKSDADKDNVTGETK